MTVINEGVDVELPEWCAALPAVNAALNSLATVLLLYGWRLVRLGKRDEHRNVMLSAFGVSVAFLICYLIYHAGLRYYTGAHGKAFEGVGVVRVAYFGLLISHVLLAAVVPVLAIVTIVRGLKSDCVRHRRIARVTFPIWLYVSVTGVMIYLLLYHWPSH